MGENRYYNYISKRSNRRSIEELKLDIHNEDYLNQAIEIIGTQTANHIIKTGDMRGQIK